MVFKEFEFEKEVKTRKKRKVAKGKVYEFEEFYINVGRISLPSEFKQFRKVKVKVIVEPIVEYSTKQTQTQQHVENVSICKCIDILADIKNFVKVIENVLSRLIEIQREFCKAGKHRFSPVGILYLLEVHGGRISFKELFGCRDVKCFVEKLKPIPIDLFREMLSKLFYLGEIPIIRFSRSFENDNIPVPGYIEPVGTIWTDSWKLTEWVKKHRDEISEILTKESNVVELPKPKVNQYFEALKNAFRRYWGRIPPSYASLEELCNLINEELRKMGLSELTFEEHRKYIEHVKREYYNCVDYYEGGLDPKHRHWVYIKEKCLSL